MLPPCQHLFWKYSLLCDYVRPSTLSAVACRFFAYVVLCCAHYTQSGHARCVCISVPCQALLALDPQWCRKSAAQRCAGVAADLWLHRLAHLLDV
eukprot:5881844-Amphidinium_carterae.1